MIVNWPCIETSTISDLWYYILYIIDIIYHYKQTNKFKPAGTKLASF